MTKRVRKPKVKECTDPNEFADYDKSTEMQQVRKWVNEKLQDKEALRKLEHEIAMLPSMNQLVYRRVKRFGGRIEPFYKEYIRRRIEKERNSPKIER